MRYFGFHPPGALGTAPHPGELCPGHLALSGCGVSARVSLEAWPIQGFGIEVNNRDICPSEQLVARCFPGPGLFDEVCTWAWKNKLLTGISGIRKKYNDEAFILFFPPLARCRL